MGVVAQEEAGFETSERRPWARDDVGEARIEHVDRAGRARTDVIAVEVVAVRAGGAERDEDEGHDGEQEHKPEPEERGAEPQVHVAGRPAGRVVWSSSIAEPTKGAEHVAGQLGGGGADGSVVGRGRGTQRAPQATTSATASTGIAACQACNQVRQNDVSIS